MLTYPNIDPVALQLGPVAIHWYGIMYLVSFVLGYFCFKSRNPWDSKKLDDLLTALALGVILGGRLGYALFYSPSWFLEPIELVKLWHGGMSFHGGLLGVLAGCAWFARKYNMRYLDLMDRVAVVTPIGLFFGRIGNFISGQLWGAPTDLPWGIVFPFVDSQARHPSQLYEALLEGALLFLILWWYSKRNKHIGRVSALFLMLYAMFRSAVELVRVPDPQYGYFYDWFTMGQLLCLPMLVLGVILWQSAIKKEPSDARL